MDGIADALDALNSLSQKRRGSNPSTGIIIPGRAYSLDFLIEDAWIRVPVTAEEYKAFVAKHGSDWEEKT